MTEVDERLRQLAAALGHPFERRLLELLDADGRASSVLELEARAQRAEDVEREARRQLKSLDRFSERQKDHVRELEESIDRVRHLHGQDPSALGLAPGKWCPGCGEEEPCRTIRAVSGKDAPT